VDDDQEALRTAATIRRGAVRLSRRLRGARARGALSGTKVGVLGHLHQRGPSSPGGTLPRGPGW